MLAVCYCQPSWYRPSCCSKVARPRCLGTSYQASTVYIRLITTSIVRHIQLHHTSGAQHTATSQTSPPVYHTTHSRQMTNTKRAPAQRVLARQVYHGTSRYRCSLPGCQYSHTADTRVHGRRQLIRHHMKTIAIPGVSLSHHQMTSMTKDSTLVCR